MDAGVDAGVIDCDTVALDPVLGTMTLASGATISHSAALPSAVTQVAVINGQLYGLRGENVVPLGAFPTLTAGNALASVRASSTVGNLFVSGYLAASGTRLLAGYTKSGAGFPGEVTMIETADAGVRRFAANGNFDAVGADALGFLINGLSVGSSTGAGVYGLFADGTSGGLVTFDSSWSSGYAAYTSNGIALLGYYGPVGNTVKAVPASRFMGVPFALAPEVEVYDGSEYVGDVATAGSSAVLVLGTFDANFDLAPTQVKRIPLTLTGNTVSVGTAVSLLSSTDTCTNVDFVQSNGASVLIGVSDRNGSRLVDVTP